MKKDFKIYLFLLVLIILGFVFYNNRVMIKEYFSEPEKIELPEEIKFEDVVEKQKNPETEEQEIKTKEVAEDKLEILEINLAVPFTIQSPDQKWEEPYKEGCEEASILMVQAFLNDQAISIASALEDIGDMVDWQLENYGGHFDLSASTTVQMAKEFLNLNAELIHLESIKEIKEIIKTGYPLILPCAGRELGNPNFKQPGPLYHMLIVKGFTKDGLIITNDPGTRKGENYVYSPDILWQAIADWDYDFQSPNQNKKLGIILK